MDLLKKKMSKTIQDYSLKTLEADIIKTIFLIQPTQNMSLSQFKVSWAHRLRSFRDFPAAYNVSPMLLAENGFVYTGSNDSVFCIFCQLVKKNWKLGDVVTDVHRELSPSCPIFARYSKTQGHIKSHATFNHNCLFANNSIETDAAPEFMQPEHDRNSSLTIQHDSPEMRPNTCLVAQCTDSNPEPTLQTVQSNIIPNSDCPLSQGQEAPRENALSPAADITTSSTSQSQSSVTPAVTSSSVTNSNAQSSSTDNPSGGAVTRENVTSRSNRDKPSYTELAIITERPKRTEYALKIKRLETYSSWPREHHLQPDELSDAGFYYAGYGDCTRCFYCGGGLRNWEDEDDVWVEHARWFPKCAFIRQQMGQFFVDTVQQLNKEMEHIPFKAVADKMGVPMSVFHLGSKILPMKRDPAVLAMVELGYLEKDVLDVAMKLKEETNQISSDSLFDKLNEENCHRNTGSDPVFFSQKINQAIDNNLLNQLKEVNNQLRQQLVCKVCLDKEVAVTFLPCGHLVSCSDCASAMKDCPLCRKHVRGIVRAFIC